MFQTKIVEKIKTHILRSVPFYRKYCRLCDKEKKIAELDRPQMIIWRMRITCWITKAKNTYSAYVIRIAFPLQPLLHERATCYITLILPSLLSLVQTASSSTVGIAAFQRVRTSAVNLQLHVYNDSRRDENRRNVIVCNSVRIRWNILDWVFMWLLQGRLNSP